MSLFFTIRHPRVLALGAKSGRSKFTSRPSKRAFHHIFSQTRFASTTPNPKHPAKPPTPEKKHAPPPKQRNVELPVRKRPIDPSRKAALLLNSSSKDGKKSEKPSPSESPAKIRVPIRDLPLQLSLKSKIVELRKEIEVSPAKKWKAFRLAKEWEKSKFGRLSNDEPITVRIDAREASVQRRIVAKRRKILWPGVWTFFALAGTCGAFAYLDARFGGGASSGETRPSERIQIPQSWFLTPSVVKEGVIAGWDELDNLTLGIVVAIIGVHLMKKSPLPFWEKLIHITGEKRYTAFTYPFTHASWSHLVVNSAALCWFLPGVVYYLDHNYFQAAALLLSFPLITSYMLHFSFRFAHIPAIPLNMGLSGVSTAAMGAFCTVYPDEKVWFPYILIGRLDAKYMGSLFMLLQLAMMLNTPAGGNRPAYLVGLQSRALYHC